MAHKKGVGSSKNGRESHSKRLGVKLFGGQHAIPGNIIIRQRGTKYHPGDGVGIGKDHTIFATVEGLVSFRRRRNDRLYVSVLPFDVEKLLAGTTPKAKTEKKAAAKEAAVETQKERKEVKATDTPPKATEGKATEEKEKAKAEKADDKKEKVDKKKEVTEKASKESSGEFSEEQRSEMIKTLLDNVGKADEKDKQDLKKIKGVGPVFEKKLNSIGIYTFEQLSKLNAAGIEALENLVNQHGRVERDDWIGQAKKLMS